MEILIKRLDEKAKLPNYASESAPGIDIYSLEEVVVQPGQKIIVPTGVAIAIPVGYVGLIIDKRGYLLGKALEIEPSVMDSSFREEIMINYVNHGEEEKVVTAGEKVAQLLVQKAEHPMLIEAEELS